MRFEMNADAEAEGVAAAGESDEEKAVTDSDNESGGDDEQSVWELLSALGVVERQAIERYAEDLRARQNETKPADNAIARSPWRARFLAINSASNVARDERMLSAQFAQFGELIHPSHVVAALRTEPLDAQRLIIRALPAEVAATVAAQLKRDDAKTLSALPAAATPNAVARLTRAAFLSQFAFAEQLNAPTDLDLLTGVELARMVRLLGVRETAVACRGISAMEAVAAFLRRFAAEDAHAIAAHISALTHVAPERVKFAEHNVHRELSAEFAAGAMLDRIGMSLLALAMTNRDDLTIKFTMQKFPYEGVAEFTRLIASEQPHNADQIAPNVVREIEHLATRVARAHALQHAPATRLSAEAR